MTTLPNPPSVDSFDELRDALLDEASEQDERMKTLIQNVRRDGRRENVAEAIAVLAGRVSAIHEVFISTMTDEQLQDVLPEWHRLTEEEADD